MRKPPCKPLLNQGRTLPATLSSIRLLVLGSQSRLGHILEVCAKEYSACTYRLSQSPFRNCQNFPRCNMTSYNQDVESTTKRSYYMKPKFSLQKGGFSCASLISCMIKLLHESVRDPQYDELGRTEQQVCVYRRKPRRGAFMPTTREGWLDAFGQP